MDDFDFKALIEQEERAHKERVRQLKNRQKEYDANTSRMREILEQMRTLMGEYRALYDSVKKTSRRRRDQMEAAGFPDTPALLAELRSVASGQKEQDKETTDAQTPQPTGDTEPSAGQPVEAAEHHETNPAGDEPSEWREPEPSEGDGWNN